jgi:inosine-uridine nucleoside N-ribohydrolase
MASQKLIIDTDPGVDDAMAILYAAAHPDLELIGLTSIFGNVSIETATRNALWLTELAGLDIPVAQGAAGSLVQETPPHADFVHGADGFGDLPPRTPTRTADARSAAEFLCAETAAAPGEVVICAVGPLTNLALALQHDPAIAQNAARVVVMGGALERRGNVNEWAEANIWNDPHAADAVFAADWSVEMLGLDVTEQVICTPEEFAGLAQAAPRFGGFLNEAAQFYFAFHKEKEGIHGCHMHDPTAVIAILYPDLFGGRSVPLTTVGEGAQAGRTILGSDRPGVDVRLTVDVEGVRREFLDRLATAP